jgi:uncharacterized lipoprotein NlpE involved in copper resistance
MKRTITVITAISLLLAGCANPATQQQLNANNQACAAGDPDACTAAQYTAQQAAAETQQNTNAAVTGLAILGVLGAVAGGAAIASSGNGGHHYYYHR